jgi:hypothetical protein
VSDDADRERVRSVKEIGAIVPLLALTMLGCKSDCEKAAEAICRVGFVLNGREQPVPVFDEEKADKSGAAYVNCYGRELQKCAMGHQCEARSR